LFRIILQIFYNAYYLSFLNCAYTRHKILGITLNLHSSPTKFVISSSNGANNALLATISSFNFALSASFNSLLLWLPPKLENAEYSNLMASHKIDSIELAAIGILKKILNFNSGFYNVSLK